MELRGSIKTGTVTNATGAPSITGTARVGQTLTAGIGTIADADNLPESFPGDYTIQWIHVDGMTETDIPGATSRTYRLTLADLGKKIKVKVDYIDGANNAESRTSGAWPSDGTILPLQIQGQDERILVDNTHSTDATHSTSGHVSQRFNTGLSTDGYALSQVLVDYDDVDGDEFALKVCTVTGADQPTLGCTEFTAPRTFPEVSPGTATYLEFTHVSGMQLMRNTAYAIVLKPAAGKTVSYGVTRSNDESSESLSDWNIAGEFRQLSGSTWNADGQSRSLRMRLTGVANALEVPVLVSAAVNGVSLVLTYDEDLDTGSVPPANAYAVTVDGGTPAEPTDVAVAGATVTLTLASAVTSRQTVTVSYTKPTSNPVQDEDDLDASSFTDEAVTNDTADRETPTVSSATVDGTSLAITFDEDLAAAANLANTAFEVKRTPQGGSEETVSLTGSPSIYGATVTLMLAAFVESTGTVKVSYTKPSTGDRNRLEDAAGNEVASFTDRAVTNNTGRNTAATGKPAIAGTPEVGQTLAVGIGTIADANGLPATFPDDYRLQWVRVDGGTETDIPGATALNYRAAAADAGKRIVVKVSFTDDLGYEETVRSDATVAVAPRSAGSGMLLDTTLTVAGESRTVRGCGPGIADNSGCDRLLGEHRLTSTDPNGNGLALSISSLRAWRGRTGDDFHLFFEQDIGDHEKENLVLVLDGRELPFSRAYFSNSHGRGVFWYDTTVSWREGETVRVQIRDAYVNRPARGRPVISGTLRVGEKLTAKRGTIADGDGLPKTFSWQWVRVEGGTETDIAGATRSAYTLTAEDLGKQLKVKASFTDRNHNAEGPLLSAAWPRSGAVAPPRRPATNVALDTVLRVEKFGGTVTGVGPYAGCSNSSGISSSCVHHLARRSFPFRNTNYHLWALFENGGGTLVMGIGSPGQPNERRGDPFYNYATSLDPGNGMVLEVDGQSFALSDSEPHGSSGRVRHWLGTLDWSRGQRVRVRVCDGPCQRLLRVANARATEGPNAALEFVVRLEPASDSAVTVRYTTSDDTAKEGEDYEETSGMLTFAPGVTEMTVSVPVVDDTEEDSGETMWLSLSDSSGASIDDNAAIGTIYNTETELEAATSLTASFEGGPDAHDGSSPFDLRVRFSQELAEGSGRKVAGALTISGATRGYVVRAGETRDHFTIPLTPSGDGDVTVSLNPPSGCDETNSVCTADGLALTDPVEITISGPAPATPAVQPLTALFRGVPKEHNGKKAFTFQVKFSKALPDGSKGPLRRALSVTGGTKKTILRLSGRTDLWQVKVEPDGHEAVTIVLPETTDCEAAGAICIGDGRKLSRAVSATVQGPPGLSVADAEVNEGAADAALAFVVTLSREPSGTVTVKYATSDGTAVAPADYEETSGTLTFQEGQVERTVSVPVHADSENEGSETMTLTLSDPTRAYLKDATATGTIHNTGPIPQAWLARFGRTVADQVLDAVDARLGAARAPGVAATVAGQALSFDAAPEDAEVREARDEEARTAALTAWLRGEDGEADRAALSGSQTVSARELFTGTSFALTGGSPGEGTVSAWGRGVISRFDGREKDLTLDGEVGNLMLGADFTRGRATAGLVLSHAQGRGGYRGASAGDIEASLTGFYPYGRYAVSERVSVWGVAGYGEGTLKVDPEKQAAMETGMDLAMASVGVRGVLLEAAPEGGAELAVKSDAMAVRTTSEAVRGEVGGTGNLAAAEADVTRLRLGLEGSRAFHFEGGASLVPSVELGVRHDGGDAETGFGADIGAGFAWSDPARGLSADVRARGLLTHEDGSFSDRGFAGSLAWDPAPGSALGPSLSIAQSVGGQASGGLEALLGPQTAQALEAANDDGSELERRTLEAKAGYGIALFDDRWTGTPELGLGFTDTGREVVLSWRMAEQTLSGLAFGLNVEGARQESMLAEGGAGHRLGLGFGWRLQGTVKSGFKVRFEGSRIEPANADAEHRVGLTLNARW